MYITAKPYGSNAPRDTWDAKLTGERWLVPPVALVRVRTVPAITAQRIQWLTYAYHDFTKKNATWRTRLAHYCIAWRLLETQPLRKWMLNLEERWLGGDATKYMRTLLPADEQIFRCCPQLSPSL